MSKTLFKENKKKLLSERKILLSRLVPKEAKKDEAQEQSGWVEYGQKTDENAAEVSEYADTLSVQQSLKDKLNEIDAALDAIKKGTYGICTNCGKHIEDARLAVVPTATLCMNCKEKH